jgi:hypothetical protein
VKPGNVMNTYRPEQGLGAFVRVAMGLASMGHGMQLSAQGLFASTGRCWLERADGQVHPGEGRA